MAKGNQSGSGHVPVVYEGAAVLSGTNGKEAAARQRQQQTPVIALDSGAIDRAQAQHRSQGVTVRALSGENNPLRINLRLSIKRIGAKG